jgi:Fe-Mn family superoxide dismutase
MPFELKPLPYAHDALEPHMSKETVFYHYDKHHAGYVDKLNGSVNEKEIVGKSLEAFIASANGSQFNFAAQIWNHDFLWKSLSPQKTTLMDDKLKELINESFGGEKTFKEEFKKVAAGEFGSGWAWLVYNPKTEQLEVMSTTDAQTPLTGDKAPLLTLDVWEHAYYIDFRNDRAKYIDTFLNQLICWSFAAENLKHAMKKAKHRQSA